MNLKNRVLILLLMLSLLIPTLLLPRASFADEGSYISTPTCIDIKPPNFPVEDVCTWVNGNTLYLAIAGFKKEYNAAWISGVDKNDNTVEIENTDRDAYPYNIPINLDGADLLSSENNRWSVFSFPLNQIVTLKKDYKLRLRYENDKGQVDSIIVPIDITIPQGTELHFKRIWYGGPKNEDLKFRIVRKTINDTEYEYYPSPAIVYPATENDFIYLAALPFADNEGFIYKYNISALSPDLPSGYTNYGSGALLGSDCKYRYQITAFYTASGSFTPEVTKKFLDGDLAEHTFRFALYQEVGVDDWALVEEVECQADGTIPFSPIVYDENDIGEVYSYRIKELINDPPGNIIYDLYVREFKVTVTDNGDGTLGADVEGLKDTVFINAWSVVDISVEKIWQNAPADKPPVTIHILRNGTSVGLVTLDGSETDPWKHTWQVPLFDETGKFFEYTVWEETVLDGYEEAEYGHLGEWAMTVTNKKILPTEIEVEIPGKKELKGRELKADEFGFSIYNASDLKNPIQSVRNAKDGTFSFLLELKEGKYEFVIKEDKGNLEHMVYDETEIQVDVLVTEDANGFLVAEVTPKTDVVFMNTYAPPKLPDTGGGVGIGYLLAGLMLLGAGIVTGRKKKEQ